MDTDKEILKIRFHSSMNKVCLSIDIFLLIVSVFPNKFTVCLMVSI